MKASDWISVKVRLPELHCDAGCIKFSEEVLLCVGNNEVVTARLVCDKSNNTMFWSASRGGSYDLEESTNWQEIVLPKKRRVMRKLTIFETNGKRFDSYEEALKYEKLCKKVDGIMSQLLPRTKEIEEGTDFNKHNKETLNGCFKAFCKECAKQIPDWEAWFTETANGIRYLSHIGRILSDYGYDFPCLYSAYNRFSCTDFNTGFEFQQPYYVTHQDEFFNRLKIM